MSLDTGYILITRLSDSPIAKSLSHIPTQAMSSQSQSQSQSITYPPAAYAAPSQQNIIITKQPSKTSAMSTSHIDGETGRAKRLRGGCIPCPVSRSIIIRRNFHSWWYDCRMADAALLSLFHVVVKHFPARIWSGNYYRLCVGLFVLIDIIHTRHLSNRDMNHFM